MIPYIDHNGHPATMSTKNNCTHTARTRAEDYRYPSKDERLRDLLERISTMEEHRLITEDVAKRASGLAKKYGADSITIEVWYDYEDHDPRICITHQIIKP